MPSKEEQKLGAPLLEHGHAPKAAMPDDMYVCIIDCLHGSIISKSPAVYLSSMLEKLLFLPILLPLSAKDRNCLENKIILFDTSNSVGYGPRQNNTYIQITRMLV